MPRRLEPQEPSEVSEFAMRSPAGRRSRPRPESEARPRPTRPGLTSFLAHAWSLAKSGHRDWSKERQRLATPTSLFPMTHRATKNGVFQERRGEREAGCSG